MVILAHCKSSRRYWHNLGIGNARISGYHTFGMGEIPYFTRTLNLFPGDPSGLVSVYSSLIRACLDVTVPFKSFFPFRFKTERRPFSYQKRSERSHFFQTGPKVLTSSIPSTHGNRPTGSVAHLLANLGAILS